MASDGKQCLAMAGKISPDLILLDIVMPETDGFEVCRKLKADPETSRIPVIFLIAHKAEAEDIVRGFEAGGSDYLTKPFNDKELLARVRTHLELKYLQDDLEARVIARTAELRETETALRVLLDYREKERRELRKNVTSNVRKVILPMIRELKAISSDSQQKSLISTIESCVSDIRSQISGKHSDEKPNLSPAEFRVAKLIKEGKTSKEAAGILNISESAVVFHRNNIRKKLGLKKKKISLGTYLQSVELN